MSAIAAASISRRAVPANAAKPSAVNLDAEKAKCESQLSDWVHCVSAATPEGKAKIEEFSAKLKAIDARIKQSDDAPASSRDAAKAVESTTAAAAATAATVTTLGSVVDVFV